MAFSIVVNERHEELATYALWLSYHDKHGRIADGGLHLSTALAGSEFWEPRKRTVSLVLANSAEGIGVMLITAEENPVGEALKKEEALAAPFLPVLFAMCDFIVQRDCYLRYFLEGSG